MGEQLLKKKKSLGNWPGNIHEMKSIPCQSVAVLVSLSLTQGPTEIPTSSAVGFVNGY